MKAVVYKSVDRQWRVRIVSENGQKLFWSEAYRRRKDATDIAKKVSAAKFIVEVDLDTVKRPEPLETTPEK